MIRKVNLGLAIAVAFLLGFIALAARPAWPQSYLDDLRNAPQHKWRCAPATGPVTGYIWAVSLFPCIEWKEFFALTPDCEVTLPAGPNDCVKVRARRGWGEENYGPWSEVSATPGTPVLCE